MSEMTMPPSVGRHPPDSPVPAPRATNGRFSRVASFTIAETCSADVGKTTKSARARNSVSPSDSYTISSSGSDSTAPGPTIVSSTRRISPLPEAVSVFIDRANYYTKRPGSASEEHLRRARDSRGVDAMVAIEIGARSRLAEVVHAERHLADAERRAQEGKRVRVAVEHRDHGHALFLGTHELFEIRARVSHISVEAVRAPDDENARQHPAPPPRAGRPGPPGQPGARGEEPRRRGNGGPAPPR